MNLEQELDIDNIPQHIAIIMDGNGRWASQKGKARIFGHRNALDAVMDTTETAARIGVKHLTLYAFSTENWKRPKREVSALMELLVSTINKEVKSLNENNIRLKAVGDLSSLPDVTLKGLQRGIELTSDNKRMDLNLALSYSSRWEIINAVKSIAARAKAGEIDIEDINDGLFSSCLATGGIPDPELMIRTSGEMRISNFLLWQLAYSELYFLEKLWPDFRGNDLVQAVLDYQNRERRFGMTGEQVKETT
jgi:undecaprenyl diphosphate synthase